MTLCNTLLDYSSNTCRRCQSEKSERCLPATARGVDKKSINQGWRQILVWSFRFSRCGRLLRWTHAITAEEDGIGKCMKCNTLPADSYYLCCFIILPEWAHHTTVKCSGLRQIGGLRFRKTTTGDYLAIHSKIALTTITVPRLVGIRQKSFNRLINALFLLYSRRMANRGVPRTYACKRQWCLADVQIGGWWYRMNWVGLGLTVKSRCKRQKEEKDFGK